ncbi:MAG: hypothetical protein K9K36_08095 [Desulfarculaceae bacterium]|nr:hypothetical protein [Desulfarculaceae bacterium]MCF8065189.1 hypothetical protein [Desulfarculaceae bacterium]MCF8124258.1 hypothetical protein [Desulfarculaceae bacterium]
MGYTLPDKTAHDWFDQLKTPFDQIWDDIQSAGTGTPKVRVGTYAEMLAYASPYNGLGWLCTDEDSYYKYSTAISGWVLIGSKISSLLVDFLAAATLTDARDELEVYSKDETDAKDQAIAAAVLGAGNISGMAISPKDVDEVTLESGSLDVDGSNYVFPGFDFDVDAAFGGGLTATTFFAIYINPSSISGNIASSDLKVLATLPRWDATKKGWYHPTNTTWRCPIEKGWIVWANSANEIARFVCDGVSWELMSPEHIVLLNTGSPAATLTALNGALNLGVQFFSILQLYFGGAAGAAYLQVLDGDAVALAAGAFAVYGNVTVSSRVVVPTGVAGGYKYMVTGAPTAAQVHFRGFFLPKF